MVRKIQVTKNGRTKASQSGATISEILSSIYMQNSIKDEHITDGVVNSNDLTWIEAQTRNATFRIEIR